jgi:hypothetical protein
LEAEGDPLIHSIGQIRFNARGGYEGSLTYLRWPSKGGVTALAEGTTANLFLALPAPLIPMLPVPVLIEQVYHFGLFDLAPPGDPVGIPPP